MRLLGITGEVLHVLKHDPAWAHTIIAWVSCTDEPGWADECLHKFLTVPPHGNDEMKDGVPLKQVAHAEQIFKSNKKIHFQRLQKQFPKVPFTKMLFFDNERGNISSVSQLGVKCVYCPDGITSEAWRQGLALFA